MTAAAGQPSNKLTEPRMADRDAEKQMIVPGKNSKTKQT
jgi:hypothetical protein